MCVRIIAADGADEREIPCGANDEVVQVIEFDEEGIRLWNR